MVQPLGPIYNNLIVFDPHNYPQIIGDLAKGWTVSADYLAYTFTLHEGVKFHDGSPLTSADVKASWDKIVFPPEGVVSTRRSYYERIKSIEAPDPSTVVFRLHHRSPSFLTNLAHPATFIYYLCQKISRSGYPLLQAERHGQRAIQVETVRAGLRLRDGAQPGILEAGVALHGRDQVFHDQG